MLKSQTRCDITSSLESTIPVASRTAAQDGVAIQLKRCAAYAWLGWNSAYDALDLESWLSVWADDKECVFTSNAFGERRGLDDLRDYYMTYKQTFSGLRHVFPITANRRRHRAYCLESLPDPLQAF